MDGSPKIQGPSQADLQAEQDKEAEAEAAKKRLQQEVISRERAAQYGGFSGQDLGQNTLGSFVNKPNKLGG